MWTESKAKAKEKANANAKRKCKGTTNRWWSDYTKSMVDVLTNAFFCDRRHTIEYLLRRSLLCFPFRCVSIDWIKGARCEGIAVIKEILHCLVELMCRPKMKLLQTGAPNSATDSEQLEKNALIVSYVSPECLLNISFNIYFYFVFLHTGTAI